MLLYLMAIQTIALFCAHYFSSKISSATFLCLVVVFLASVGGYMIHPFNISHYLKWLEIASPLKWTLPILTEYEYSRETLRSTTTLECKNKQVLVQTLNRNNIKFKKNLNVLFPFDRFSIRK